MLLNCTDWIRTPTSTLSERNATAAKPFLREASGQHPLVTERPFALEADGRKATEEGGVEVGRLVLQALREICQIAELPSVQEAWPMIGNLSGRGIGCGGGLIGAVTLRTKWSAWSSSHTGSRA